MPFRSPLVLLIAILGALAGLTPAAAASASGTQVAPAAATVRYFGHGPWDAVRSAVHAAARPCPITDDGLTALVVAPVFFESSAATTAASAPAPMTLSRYDEWNGIAGTTAPSSNYGLYAFRDPSTAYQRAYWSPGIGIWQYDGGGLGAPLTTVEAMDAGVVAADVAKQVAQRYCSATGSDLQRRDAAWSPWAGCNAMDASGVTVCEKVFQDLYSTSPHFANLKLVSGIDRLGGVVQRTCAISGTPGTMPCWYVNPYVDPTTKATAIQGSTAWATLTPSGAPDSKTPPAPLPLAFYVVDRGTTEERHWLNADTGYGVDIKAVRTLGKNPRPSSQTGSGLTWSTGSGLCDVSAGRGACVPIAPAGVSSAAITIGSGYQPITLDANGDGQGDILWYQPGSGADALWFGTGGGTFTKKVISVNSTYDKVLPLDVDGDGDDDVLWYSTSSGSAYLWRSNGDGTFASSPLSPGAGLVPLIANLHGGAKDEVVWYGPGAKRDAIWAWSGSVFVPRTLSVAGTYTPFVGDFDGNGVTDIFWYATGATPDYAWFYNSTGAHADVKLYASGTQKPLVGDFDGDHEDDIFWYAAGSAADAVWWGKPNGFTPAGASVVGTYQPLVVRLTAADRDQIVWYAPGYKADSLWSWTSGRVLGSSDLYLPSTHTGVPGAFASGGYEGVLWYDPGSPPDSVWYR